jgi:hypothetical protein
LKRLFLAPNPYYHFATFRPVTESNGEQDVILTFGCR